MTNPASEVLEADLVKTPASLGRRLLGALEAVLSSDPTAVRSMDLVVRRIDTGHEILRTTADLGDPFLLLDRVRADLEEKTVEEFLDEWRVREV